MTLEDLVAPPRPVRDGRGFTIGTRYATTWALGRRAVRLGADGLLVPSGAIRPQKILVVLPEGLAKPGLRLVSCEQLLTDPRLTGGSAAPS